MWKSIKGYEGLYEVSDSGEVKSLKRKARVKGNSYRTVNERILKPSVSNGYKSVVLCKDLTYTKIGVHRLVAEAFIPNPNNYPIINHKDANPSNNNVDNIEWCTYKYNSNYHICKIRQSEYMLQRYKKNPEFLQSVRDRLDKFHAEIQRPVCQLTLNDELVKIWSSASEAGRSGFISNNISCCSNGKRHTHRGYKWMFLEDYEKKFGGVLS